MRRILSVLTVALVMAAIVVASAAPAFAAPNPNASPNAFAAPNENENAQEACARSTHDVIFCPEPPG
jgi:hypothetical protein